MIQKKMIIIYQYYHSDQIMAVVSNFQDKILAIRDILRQSSAPVTGMDSMQHICIYVVARFMSVEHARTMGIPDKYVWENMIHLLDVNGGEQTLYDMFHDSSNDDNFMKHIGRLFGTACFVFGIKEISTHTKIMKLMDSMDIDRIDCEIDILGWIYEQHLRTGAKVARDLGQFFTNRSICKYMISHCDPRINADGTLETVCDPSMGTGGFLMMIMKHYNGLAHINWTEHTNAIHGCDSDSKVAAIARMNLFMETKGVCTTNLVTRNSLYSGLPLRYYNIIVANPPFGLDNIDYEQCCVAIRRLRIRSTTSTVLFLQLIMASLTPGGRAAVVMPITFTQNVSSQFARTRQHLIENFQLTKIVEIPSKFFTNTRVATCILIFVNSEYSTGNVDIARITSNPSAIDATESIICTITRADIERNAFSLDLHTYTAQPIMRNPDTPEQLAIAEHMCKLEDVCDLIPGTQIPSKFVDSHGSLKIINHQNILSGRLVRVFNQKYALSEIDDGYQRPIPGDIVISTAHDCGRCARVSEHGWIINSDLYIARARDHVRVSPTYLFWYLYAGGFYEMMFMIKRGISTKHIRREDIHDAPIYVPSLDEQMRIVDEFITMSKQYDELQAQCSSIDQAARDMAQHIRHRINPLVDVDALPANSLVAREQRDVLPYM
jgi:hypothetical protein